MSACTGPIFNDCDGNCLSCDRRYDDLPFGASLADVAADGEGQHCEHFGGSECFGNCSYCEHGGSGADSDFYPGDNGNYPDGFNEDLWL